MLSEDSLFPGTLFSCLSLRAKEQGRQGCEAAAAAAAGFPRLRWSVLVLSPGEWQISAGTPPKPSLIGGFQGTHLQTTVYSLVGERQFPNLTLTPFLCGVGRGVPVPLFSILIQVGKQVHSASQMPPGPALYWLPAGSAEFPRGWLS